MPMRRATSLMKTDAEAYEINIPPHYSALPRRCGWQAAGSAPIEKSFRNVAIRRCWVYDVAVFEVKKEIPDEIHVTVVISPAVDRYRLRPGFKWR
ncbi:hypothetical protein SBA7_270019 [Candidatus Sulfotelmatobacter sp. SbA7]|nr:hypothetical protein SBA7_270019 [Candidatus Sulfotelmatobacter sp. SbA7]